MRRYILFCHYGFLPLVTSPNLSCFTASLEGKRFRQGPSFLIAPILFCQIEFLSKRKYCSILIPAHKIISGSHSAVQPKPCLKSRRGFFRAKRHSSKEQFLNVFKRPLATFFWWSHQHFALIQFPLLPQLNRIIGSCTSKTITLSQKSYKALMFSGLFLTVLLKCLASAEPNVYLQRRTQWKTLQASWVPR